jgi:hypothetical protein
MQEIWMQAIYPYLLKEMDIARANVWSIDITYIPIRSSFRI